MPLAQNTRLGRYEIRSQLGTRGESQKREGEDD